MSPVRAPDRPLSLALSLAAVSVALISVGIASSGSRAGTAAVLVLLAAELVGLAAIGVLFAVLRGDARRTQAEVERGR